MGKFRQVKGITALAVALCMVLSGPVLVHAGSEEDGPPAISAPSYLLMEPVTGKVLLESNADEARSPASITKVMTLLLTMEALDEGRIQEEDMVTATEHACSMNGSQIWLEPGEKMAVRDLIKAVAVGSANDAAVALAEHLGGSEEDVYKRQLCGNLPIGGHSLNPLLAGDEFSFAVGDGHRVHFAHLAVHEPGRFVGGHPGVHQHGLVTPDVVIGESGTGGVHFHNFAEGHQAQLHQSLEAVADAAHQAVPVL